jgi:hypothetical protein
LPSTSTTLPLNMGRNTDPPAGCQRQRSISAHYCAFANKANGHPRVLELGGGCGVLRIVPGIWFPTSGHVLASSILNAAERRF